MGQASPEARNGGHICVSDPGLCAEMPGEGAAATRDLC